MKKIAFLIAALLIFLSPLSAEEPEYTNNSFARLSFTTGTTYIQRAADLGFEEAEVNTPITEGDRLGTTDGRAEIYLGKGNYIRLDKNSKIDFLNLPKKDYGLVRVRIWAGNAYFHVRSLKEEKDIEIHTPDVSIYVLDAGLYRIDVRENRKTEIFVYSGMVEAAGEEGSVLIKDEQRLEVSNARFTSRPARFMAVAEDSFDRWSAQRDSEIRRYLAKRYLPEELGDFEYELAAYGNWVYTSPYGYVWVPGRVSAFWRPYYDGRWIWIPLCGWTWVPYEPWGWCTFHYGRWHWQYGLGWYWIPTTVWGPAWVHWYWGYGYCGWAPISYYGYPGVIINNYYYPRYGGAHYPSDSRALTVIRKNQLKAPRISKVALREDSVKKLGKITLSSKRPPIRPEASKITPERLESNKILLRKTAESSARTEDKRLSKSKGRNPEPVDAKRTVKNVKGNESTASSSSQRTVEKGKYGYPSSSKVSAKNYPRKIETRKSNSIVNRIAKDSSKSSKTRKVSSSSSRSSSRSGSKKVSSTSRSRSSSSSARRSSSSRSSRSSSGSRSVRKKK